MKPRILFGYLLGFVFLGFALAPVGVQASEAIGQVVATVTNTFIPPSVTPTDSNFACPVGTPAGWGTYTPSPLWLVQCSGCSVVVTPTVADPPTSTTVPTFVSTQAAMTGTAQFLTGTPTVTQTVTQTVTATVAAYPSLTCAQIFPATITCTQIDDHTILYGGVAGNTAPYTQGVGFQYTTSAAAPGLINAVFNIVGTNNAVIRHYPTSSAQSFEIWQRGPSTNRWLLNLTADHTVEAGSVGVETVPNGSYSFSYTAVAGSGELYWNVLYMSTRQYFWNASIIGGTGGSTLLLSTAPLLSLTPTVTPTVTGAPTVTATPPFDTGYCASVAPLTDVFGFDLFVPDGAPNCDMGWDEFGVGEYVIPAVQICFQPSQIGVITLFGNAYEAGVFALAAAAAFLWRFFRTV
jgi:hypothetical protein